MMRAGCIDNNGAKFYLTSEGATPFNWPFIDLFFLLVLTFLLAPNFGLISGKRVRLVRLFVLLV